MRLWEDSPELLSRILSTITLSFFGAFFCMFFFLSESQPFIIISRAASTDGHCIVDRLIFNIISRQYSGRTCM